MSVVHKPITPGEAKRRHFAEFVPDEIYEVIDDLLTERYGTSIKIRLSPKLLKKCRWMGRAFRRRTSLQIIGLISSRHMKFKAGQ